MRLWQRAGQPLAEIYDRVEFAARVSPVEK